MKNKDLTKQKIIDAVGEVFKTEGQKGLYIVRIAKEAGVDRSLIYQYFGRDIKRLIEAYIVQKDYWLKFFEKINEEVGKRNHEAGKDLIIDVLQKQWQYLSTDMEMQHLILWELSGDSELMRSIHNTRELMAEPILELADQKFKDTIVQFRPIAVLLLGGIYYANVHSIYNGSIICGMDVRSKEGQKTLLKAIQQIIEWAYEHAA
ncbi:transcriptional regulator, TetR family [Mucilaginibacter mallensis]|uniref:Transcriptional regulator, TetR family n=1 Tax=Mucilaginibacter mallensis TaxID=652787 RepID=A0A1H2BE30_MUCMA|nr:TetR/AcrR family transcriptional regulator [Mucilaginibacter mallensis]SDT56282.1 transcriptional regulator, TetR family [Mucilaginibacter mallensis]